MMSFLGLDTSNYTTSCALFSSADRSMRQERRLLPVREGQKGLRQSDAVFHHTRQLSDLMHELLACAQTDIRAVGASVAPRDQADSYMPCFLVGKSHAAVISSVLGIPFFSFSHQAGHIAAGVFSCACTSLIHRPFIAFHVSGGTTDLLYVRPDRDIVFSIKNIASSLDLHAGQLIDRVGISLGLSFPAGPSLDALAVQSNKEYKLRPAIKNGCAALSGIENQCARMFEKGNDPCDIARFCIDSIGAALIGMVQCALADYGNVPVLFVGGVMCNTILRSMLSAYFSDAYFASGAFSSDNACGIAYLTYLKYNFLTEHYDVE